MRFSFPLQTLLNWKRSLEEHSQMRLAEMSTRLRAKEREIERLTLKRLSYERALKEKTGQGVAAGEYVLYKLFSEESLRELLFKEEEKRRTIREIEKERAELLALTKEKKTLEKLKEKRLKNFFVRMEKAEQKENDEISTMKYKPPSRRKGPQ
jgi:flagellar FliJ protein